MAASPLGTGTAWPPTRTLTLNASVAFVSAQLVLVLLHETSHLVAGLALGYANVMYPFGVEASPQPGRADATIIALTGPAFSLVTGLLAMVVMPWRRRGGFLHLAWLWFAFMSVMEGAGYLVLTPFGVGDTGATAASYGSPAYVIWPAFAVGVAIPFWLAMRFAWPAVRHTAGDLTSLRAFTFFPWIGGTIAVVALSALNVVLSGVLSGATFTTGEIVAILVGAIALGVFAPMTMPFTQRLLRRAPDIAGSEPMFLPRVPITGIVIIVVVTLVNLVVLSRGLSVG